ncbi:MAG TPA: biotin/lipoyl-containing protein [Gemmatimonadaceae bacterium]|nr:biotin/lipoyl-containing protein [Gemmatimonadaceae bacterium]
MKYVVDVNGKRHTLVLEASDVTVDGRQLHASLDEVMGTPVRLVRIGDEVHRVVVRARKGRGEYTLWIDGYSYDVEALDERTRVIRDLSAASAKPSGPAPLIAPMPGLVVRVLIEPGQAVGVGQGLVVMEAMKMENELRAPAPGVVRAIRVTPGTAVEKGAILVELD